MQQITICTCNIPIMLLQAYYLEAKWSSCSTQVCLNINLITSGKSQAVSLLVISLESFANIVVSRLTWQFLEQPKDVVWVAEAKTTIEECEGGSEHQFPQIHWQTHTAAVTLGCGACVCVCKDT